jgi:hypothetical protein
LFRDGDGLGACNYHSRNQGCWHKVQNIMARRSGNGQWVKPDAASVDKQLMDSVCSMPLSETPAQ